VKTLSGTQTTESFTAAVDEVLAVTPAPPPTVPRRIRTTGEPPSAAR
jgi:hypothetical protein